MSEDVGEKIRHANGHDHFAKQPVAATEFGPLRPCPRCGYPGGLIYCAGCMAPKEDRD